MDAHYNHLNIYLKNLFGERTLKICIDGGFTCPNRDGKVASGGCIFCSEHGSGDLINKSNCSSQIQSITNQVKNYLSSYRASRANKFIAYFQNFTNTYDSIANLKSKYDSALIDDRIVGLDIATRPDCINDDVVKLLKSYTDKYKVFVELGLQTCNDETANFINRGYSSFKFTEAVELLNRYSIPVIVHIMVGLPNETEKDIENTVSFVNKHNIQGIKIHSTYVVENTKLCDLYRAGLYTPISFESYMNSLVYIITHIKPDVIIHRISADPPKNIFFAPDWSLHKKWVMNGLDKILDEKNLYQGMFYKE
jgi:hypothetical protein